MAYFLLFASVFVDTLKNIFLNMFGKDYTKTYQDAFLFNAVCCVGGLLLLICLGPEFSISSYSMILAFFFAFVTAMAQFFLLMSMATGSMSFSVLFSYLGLIVPTLYSILIGAQSVKAYQLIGLLLMIVTLYLCVGAKSETKITLKWIIYSVLSFLAWGGVGLIQFLHQSSPHKDEISGFLIWSFIIMIVMFFVMYLVARKNTHEEPKYIIKSNATWIALGAGVIVGATNKVNLYLSGVLPSIVFFPIINGGVIILSGIASILVFKEKLNKNQIAGIILGIVSICLLGM